MKSNECTKINHNFFLCEGCIQHLVQRTLEMRILICAYTSHAFYRNERKKTRRNIKRTSFELWKEAKLLFTSTVSVISKTATWNSNRKHLLVLHCWNECNKDKINVCTSCFRCVYEDTCANVPSLLRQINMYTHIIVHIWMCTSEVLSKCNKKFSQTFGTRFRMEILRKFYFIEMQNILEYIFSYNKVNLYFWNHMFFVC